MSQTSHFIDTLSLNRCKYSFIELLQLIVGMLREHEKPCSHYWLLESIIMKKKKTN